jgi:hypothetical protein
VVSSSKQPIRAADGLSGRDCRHNSGSRCEGACRAARGRMEELLAMLEYEEVGSAGLR